MMVSVIGVGAMGRNIALHVQSAGNGVLVFDVDEESRAAAQAAGLAVASSLAEAVAQGEVHLIVVATDAQSEYVTQQILEHGQPGSTIVVVATNSPRTMQALSAQAQGAGFSFVDAPVCYGLKGAEEGVLVSLCGGTEEALRKVSPVLMCYSRAIHHIGPAGAGQLAKACNNMLHWAACVANYEVLLLAKRYGIDAQRMREVLLDCPGHNVTLKRWDTSRFTWHEKDMDLALDLAQAGGVPLPLFGQVDQLVKRLGPDQVRDLLYGPEADYLGLTIKPMEREKGGLV